MAEQTDDAAIVAAAHDFVDTCMEALGDVATTFSCHEADTIHALMVACGATWADEWMAHHADGDDLAEGDRHVAVRDDRQCPIAWRFATDAEREEAGA